MKKLFLMFLLSFVGMTVSAHDFEVDGIYYTCNKAAKIATVTYAGDDTWSKSYSGDVHIPASVEYEGVVYSVIGISEKAFYGCGGLTSVTIPEGVMSIGERAFSDCYKLTSVTIPEGVTSINAYAFANCFGLTSVTIPSSLTSIGSFAFSSCSGLKKVIIKDLAAWCGISFDLYYNGNPLSYANHLYSDEETEITDLVIPDGVTSINYYTFWGCSSLTSVTIPSSVTSIGAGAFSDCSGLTSVTIPESVTSISENAFFSCSSLTELFIPKNVASIDGNPFAGCSSLEKIVVEDGNPYYNSMGNCNAIIRSDLGYVSGNSRYTDVVLIVGCKNTRIFDGITEIGASAFKGSGLTEVVIPNTVASIGEDAFQGCANLESVTLGCCVSAVNPGASVSFRDCPSLGIITSRNPTPPYGAFEIKTVQLALLHVPEGCKDAYLAKWSGFNSNFVFDDVKLLDNIVAITAENFPDENFRNYLLEKDVDKDNVLNEVEYYGLLAGMDVRNRGISDLTGIELFPALKSIQCLNNQLTSLDLSKNTKLTYVDCYSNQLTDLKVSKDASFLKEIRYYKNQVKGKALDALIDSLPQNASAAAYEYKLCIYLNSEANDDNVMTKTQVAAAKSKGWTPCIRSEVRHPLGYTVYSWIEYEGSDDGLPGDANGDGVLTTADVVETVNCIMGTPSKAFVEKMADMNGDGKITTADVVAIIALLTEQE